jgi:hypothetical protein
MTVLIYEEAHSEHVKVIKCDITPGSIERSSNENEMIPEKGVTLGAILKFRCAFSKLVLRL